MKKRQVLLALVAVLLTGAVPAVAGPVATSTVVGTIRDKVTQTPLSGVTVEITKRMVTIGEPPFSKSAITGQDGRYMITGLSSVAGLKFQIRAVKNGYVSEKRILSSRREDFLLRKPAIAGTIRRLDGAGIENVQIRIGSMEPVSSGTNGEYKVENVPSGTYPVVLQKPGYVSPQDLTVMVADADQLRNDYTLQGNIVVKGRITSDDGRPVSGLIRVAGRFAQADEQGIYSTESSQTGGVAPGSYVLTASADGFANSSQTVNLTDGVQTVDVTLHRLFVLKGRVSYETPTGAGVDHLTVTVTNTSSGASYTTMTEGGGLYAVANLPAGSYSLRMRDSDYEEYTDTFTISEHASRSFSVQPRVLTNLELHLRCSADTFPSHGTPICGANVTLTNVNNVASTGRPDGSPDRAPYCHYDWSNAKAGYYTLKLNDHLSRSYHVQNASEVILLDLHCTQFQPISSSGN